MQDDYSYFQDEEFRTSIAAYERMLTTGEPVELDAETLTDIAEFYAMQQRDEDACRCIEYALSFYPDSIDPQIFLARRQMFLGHQKEAWDIFYKIPDQDDREMIFLRAELEFREEKEELAFAQLMEYYRLLDEEEAADFLYDSIMLLKDYDYLNKALEWAKILHEEYPDDTAALSLLAGIYNAKGQYQKASRIIEEHIEEIPFDVEAWLQLAEAQLWMEHYKEALEAVDYALAICEDDANALLMRANILYDSGDSAQAHLYYTRFLSYYPQDMRATYMDAQSLVDTECYEQAILQLEKMTQAENAVMRGHALSLLAYCHSKLKHEEESLHYRLLAEKEHFNNLGVLFPELYPNEKSRSDGYDSLSYDDLWDDWTDCNEDSHTDEAPF